MKILGVVYPKPIAGARADVGDTREIPAFFSFQRMKCSVRVFRRALFEDKINVLRLWRPNTKMRFVFANQFRSDRITAFCERHHVTLTSSIARRLRVLAISLVLFNID